MSVKPKVTRFKESVLAKFQIYNSIFLTLPFDKINKTGVLLPLFHETCLKGFKHGNDPSKIVENFLLHLFRYLLLFDKHIQNIFDFD